ncbi:MAG: flagellar motor switch protein FliN [Halobacteria archaeon]|nr:flagellar motor switch protein FliN [Halobacteria archaeon]
MDVNDGAQEQGVADQEGAAAPGEATGENYERASFDELGESGGAVAQGETSLDVILDIPVTLSMEIGRSRISIENLLQLAKGSVVELDRMAGEPLDVLVNGTLVARGEVVVVNDKFGVRLSDVISPAERVKSLK